MNQTVLVFNRQRVRPVNLRLLRRTAVVLLRDLLPLQGFCVGISLVGHEEMIALNEAFLNHRGSTDVITFDYSEKTARTARPWQIAQSLEGEIFICVDEALSQARRFRVPWPREIARYVIHGVLHLCGYDDQRPAARRKMKLRENRLLRDLSKKIPLNQLARK